MDCNFQVIVSEDKGTYTAAATDNGGFAVLELSVNKTVKKGYSLNR